MAVSKEPVAVEAGAAGGFAESDAATVGATGLPPASLLAEIRALESKRLFLEFVGAWQQARQPVPCDADLALEGASLEALRHQERRSSVALSRALSEERSVLLRL